ncbi:MAG: ribosome assembly factor SBDS [Candidatus Aenigmarchaeota archaeon]|nr:ribosome assembly factor SBDS [Candidatus Aenigmarchaeota archaeon]
MVISVEKAVVARINRNGKKFEILVDPEKAFMFRSGKDIPIDDLIASREVYEDSRKGKRVSEEDLNKAFGTNNIEEICKIIILKGDVQLTTEQRHEMLENKKKQIATIISKRGINPQTGLPNPIERVLRAMEEAKVKVDINTSAESQVENVIKSIQSIMPIKIEKMKLSIMVAPRFSGKISNIVRTYGKIIHEQWNSDGSYSCIIEIDAGSQKSLVDKINTITHGDNEIKVVK